MVPFKTERFIKDKKSFIAGRGGFSKLPFKKEFHSRERFLEEATQ